MKLSLILLIPSLLISLQHGFAASSALSLEDLITIAMKNNPQIEVARQQYMQSKGVITQAKANYLPQLGVVADMGRAHIEDLEPTEEDTILHGRITGSQLIYDFGKTTGLIDSSLYSSAAAESNLLQQLQNVAFLVKQNYYQVLEREELIKVAKESVNSYTQHLYRAEKYFTAGVRTKIDVTNAKVELANSQLDLLRAESNLKTARVKLVQILGTSPNGGKFTLERERKPLAQLSSSKPEMRSPLEALLKDAKENRPELKRVDSLVQASKASITQAEGDYYPTLQAVGNYDAYETDFSNLQDQWNIGIALNWEIFSGFATQGKVAEARGRLHELKASLRELELAISQEVNDSYLRADENREAVDIADQTLTLAQENLLLAEGRYKAGLNDIIEFNDAQLTYTRSQSNLVSTYYAYLTALARIEFSTGTITIPAIPESTAISSQ